MLFHPIINQLANLDMTFLVKPAENQCIDGQTACFCPFCQKEAANDNAGSKAKQTPHLIIYKDERGGLDNGVGVDDDRQAEHGAVRWMCTKTGKHGYEAWNFMLPCAPCLCTEPVCSVFATILW